MTRTMRLGVMWFTLLFATAASAQQLPLVLNGPNLLPFTPSWSQTFGVNVPSAAQGSYQAVYPYPGQCLANASAANLAAFPGLLACPYGGSFDLKLQGPTATRATCAQTAGDWLDCGGTAPKAFLPVNPQLPPSIAALPAPAGFGTVVNPKYYWDLLNPFDYLPDTAKYPGADYYEIGLHEAIGFQAAAGLGLFPDPLKPTTMTCTNGATTGLCAGPVGARAGAGVPTGKQWTGLRCNNPAGCLCRSDANANYCLAGSVPFGAPLYTQIWGVGQMNWGGGVGVGTGGAATTLPVDPTGWSSNYYIATWPSVSIRANRGTPVVVKWTNEFPNNHVYCPHPEAADWPCAIDRTFMGVKPTIDPALRGGLPDGMNPYGGMQQPDNSWVTHLHGGEIPPSTDGFAEKWFGNAITSAMYSPVQTFVNPPFEAPFSSPVTANPLKRPAGNSDVYTYPMVQEEALIWFHDHTLGKTHHNVLAGPAGFFPVRDPLRHGDYATAGVCTNPAPCPVGRTCDCQYTWLDPVTKPVVTPLPNVNVPLYDLFLAIQDRSFSEDGSINFSNFLGQPVVLPVMGPNPGVAANGNVAPLACFAAGTCVPQGTTPITPGVNPQVHPVWIPEYFGDHALVNGVLWPKKAVDKGWYRIRIVDGSDSRCWQIGFSTTQPVAGRNPTNNVQFYIVANDQGYLPKPVLARNNNILMCPGERYELLVNFGALPTNTVGGVRVPATNVWMTNNAPAPFPVGVTPQAAASPFVDLDTIMRFDLTANAGIATCAGSTAASPYGGFTQTATVNSRCIPNPAFVLPDTEFNLAEAKLRPPVGTAGVALQNFVPPGAVVRVVFMNEQHDGLTGFPTGMQLDGVPFEFKVTETPKKGTVEVWKFVNLTVDAHPMHPHLVRHLLVSRQNFNVNGYKTALCGGALCQPTTAPGGNKYVVVDPTPFLGNANNAGVLAAVTSASEDGAFKDASIVRPNQVTTIVADWTPRWPSSATPSAPGQCTGLNCTTTATTWTYEDVTAGPYVWHCHINSHEDSEMMRTSLVVP